MNKYCKFLRTALFPFLLSFLLIPNLSAQSAAAKTAATSVADKSYANTQSATASPSITSNAARNSFGGDTTAQNIVKNAVAKQSPAKAISYLKEEIPKITIPAQKRALLAFLGGLQESVSYFDDARASYASAAAIAAADVPGMAKKSSQQLVLDAVRCALCAGQSETAVNYLNSAVRNSKNEVIQAQIKLYEQWAALCSAESAVDISEPLSMLKTYDTLPSMKSVRPSVLLTLWYLTGNASYSQCLKKEYPYSAECGIVTGKVQVLPAPFWYFVPRQAVAETVNPVLAEMPPETSSSEKAAERERQKEALIAAAKERESGEKKQQTQQSISSVSTIEKNSDKPVRHQLGLFRDKVNALEYAKKVSAKGFDATVQSETRASGTTYYLVVVPENANGNMAAALKSAGFESYPLFD